MTPLLLSLFVATADAAPRADALSWTHAGVAFSGFLVYDDAVSTPRPGVVMVPNWMGVTPAAVEKAKLLAGTRYVVLVADVYGKDLRPRDDKEASAAAGALYADRALLRGRAAAAVSTLQAQAPKAPVDPTRVGAIGFCFGGTTVLELARAGADLDGVVSFHGGLATTVPAAAGKVKAPILVLNGAADTYVPPEDLAGFQKEMTAAGADWQLVQLSGAVHCFTEVGADKPGCSYDAKAARRSYAMMSDFFDEGFGR